MTLVGGIIIVTGFIFFVKLFGLIEKSTKVITISKSAVTIVRDAGIDDYEKEVTLQRYARDLFYLFFLIATASFLALAIPFGIIWLMELADLLVLNEVIETTLSLKFIIVTVIVSAVIFWVGARRKGEEFRKSTFHNRRNIT